MPVPFSPSGSKVMGPVRIPPEVFVNVASKGLRIPVNSLESTLIKILANVASKGLREIVGVGSLGRFVGMDVGSLPPTPPHFRKNVIFQGLS